jgi:hypothetical protein
MCYFLARLVGIIMWKNVFVESTGRKETLFFLFHSAGAHAARFCLKIEPTDQQLTSGFCEPDWNYGEVINNKLFQFFSLYGIERCAIERVVSAIPLRRLAFTINHTAQHNFA